MTTKRMGVTVVDGRCGHAQCEREGSYFAEVQCTNCNFSGEIHCTKSHTIRQSANYRKCPRCRCRDLRGGEYLRNGDDPSGG